MSDSASLLPSTSLAEALGVDRRCEGFEFFRRDRRELRKR
jgi:hypothetical protein